MEVGSAPPERCQSLSIEPDHQQQRPPHTAGPPALPIQLLGIQRRIKRSWRSKDYAYALWLIIIFVIDIVVGKEEGEDGTVSSSTHPCLNCAAPGAEIRARKSGLGALLRDFTLCSAISSPSHRPLCLLERSVFDASSFDTTRSAASQFLGTWPRASIWTEAA